MRGRQLSIPAWRSHTGALQPRQELVTVEEPLLLRVGEQDAGVVERTPGNDFELAAGLLFAAGIITRPAELAGLDQPAGLRNVVRARLVAAAQPVETLSLEPPPAISNCGICAQNHIRALEARPCRRLVGAFGPVASAVLERLAVRTATSGLCAASLHTPDGGMLSSREDFEPVNAIDKLLGAEFLAGRLPGEDQLLFLDAAPGFQAVRRALLAGIPLMAATGSATSLAVQAAVRFNLTLVDHLAPTGFRLCAGAARVRMD